MRNAIAAILAIAMLVTSALIALDLATLLRAPLDAPSSRAEETAGAGHERLIATFYEAANALLAGERSSLLATVVSADVETHAASGGAFSGERGIQNYLEGLRQRGAGSLAAVSQMRGHDQIAVVVEAHETPRFGVDAPQSSATPRWRTVDLFRVAAGMIVEFWPGALAAPASRTLPSLSVPASAQMMSVSLARVELSPGAAPTPLFAPVPHLLIVETGTLAVSRGHAFEIARAEASRFVPVAADPGAGELHAGPGDALLFPEVLPLLVRNPGDSNASALSLLVAPSSVIFQQIRAGPATNMTVEGAHDGWRVGRRTAWENHVITETLAVKHLPLNRNLDDIALTSSQVSLEIGQRHPPLTPGALRLAIVRAGAVGVSVINSDAVPISVPNPDSQLAQAANHLFWAGDAFWIEASEAPVVANAGVTPLDILLIEAVPREADTATPKPYATEPLQTRRRPE